MSIFSFSWCIVLRYFFITPSIYIYNQNFWNTHIFPRQHLIYLFFLFFKFQFFSQPFMRLMTLSNLYAFLKPKTLTFELSLSLSPLCLGSCRFPFLSLYLKPLPYKPSPFTHSLLLCSLFADFSVFSGNLYDFTLDLKFSAFFH